ncbi:hypothetical protein ABK040_009929 [Willaertia magna]
MCCSSNKDPTTSALFTSQLEQPLSLTSTSPNFINTVNNSNENTNTSNNTSNNNLFTPIRRFSYLCNDSPSPIDEASLEEHMLQFNGTENNNKVLKPTTPNNAQTTRKKTKLYNSTNPLSFSNNNTTFLQEKEGLNNIKTKESLSNGSKRKSVMSSPSTSSSTMNSLVMVISTPLEIKQEIDQKEAKERSGLKRKRGRPKKVL